jgi:hypothetical protein
MVFCCAIRNNFSTFEDLDFLRQTFEKSPGVIDYLDLEQFPSRLSITPGG